MKFKFTLLNFLLFICVAAFSQAKHSPATKSRATSPKVYKKPGASSLAQANKIKATSKGLDITGIWRGYFAQNSFGVFDDRYKFEVQIEQLADNAVSGVTYSYKTTVFYGKATLQGIFFKSTKTVVINEIKLVELKIGDMSQPCLMKCDLEYEKMGELETLTGTYTSRNVSDKGDCGSGKVYLEKTPKSDFYKEEFLVKRENQKKRNDDVVRKDKPTPPVKQKQPVTSPLKDVAKNAPKVKPGAEGNLIDKPKSTPYTKPPEEAIVTPPQGHREEPPKAKPLTRTIPRPEVLRRRDNELVKTFTTSVKDIKIELYDNGEIDGDTITVYHNNELIVSKKRLTDKPITFYIHADQNSPHHEFVMVAENLGSIPPNTALMIITAGDQRYETFVTSTEQKNAVVVLDYKPEQD